MLLEEGTGKHLTSSTGVALCGLPAKQAQLVGWDEADCAHCVALHAQRATRLTQ